MSDAESSLEQILPQLKCHFTWNLFQNKEIPEDLEERVLDDIVCWEPKYKGTMYNLLAYIKHVQGQDEEALEYLRQAEESFRQERADQAEVRNLVTWGNFAWVYYRLGRLPEAQAYVDKVKQVCERFGNPFSVECPELDSEEGWTRYECGNDQIKRALVCFEKALEQRSQDPEFVRGHAIALDQEGGNQKYEIVVSRLREACTLNPGDTYVKLLLALKLQEKTNPEGDKIVEECLTQDSCDSGTIQQAARFYRVKNDLDKAIELLERALEMLPKSTRLRFIIGTCYKEKYSRKVSENTNLCSDHDALNVLLMEAIDHLTRSDNLRNRSSVNLHLADLHATAGELDKAERYFQREFSKDLPPSDKQKLCLEYGNFQWYQKKNEDAAAHHYMEGMRVNRESQERNKMRNQLKKIANKRISKNETDPLALQIFEFLKQQ